MQFSFVKTISVAVLAFVAFASASPMPEALVPDINCECLFQRATSQSANITSKALAASTRSCAGKCCDGRAEEMVSGNQ